MFQHIQLAYMHACMRLDALGHMPNTRNLRLRVFVHACLHHPSQDVLDLEPNATHHPNKHQASIVKTTLLRSLFCPKKTNMADSRLSQYGRCLKVKGWGRGGEVGKGRMDGWMDGWMGGWMD